jgi:hypothetical protein
MEVTKKDKIILKEDNEHYSGEYECYLDGSDPVSLSLTFKSDPSYRCNLYSSNQVALLREFLNLIDKELKKLENAKHHNQ